MPKHEQHGAETTLSLMDTQRKLTSEELRPSEDAGKRYHRRRFLALDGLRGVAVLLVILAHGSRAFLPETFLLRGGWLGVMVFFVLSGFLITHLLLEERASTGRISLTKFYARRALRIWPLYFGVLGIYVFVLPLFDEGKFDSIYRAIDDPDSLRNHYYLFAYPLFLQNYLVSENEMQFGGLDVLWSLAVEEHFYLFWPLLLVALRGRWLVPSLVGIAAATFSLRALTIMGVLPKPANTLEMTHTALDGLAAGCLVACLYHYRPEMLKAFSRRRWLYLLGWALLLFLVWRTLEQMPLSPDLLPKEDYLELTLAALAAAVIVACAVGGAGPPRAILCSRPLTYVGKVSYGMYVFHPIVLRYVDKTAIYFGPLQGVGYLLALTVYCAAVVGVAGLSFKYFEAPILRFKKRFERV